MDPKTQDIIIVGGGPIGLEVAANAQAAGLSSLVLDAGCLGQTFAYWPPDTPFFSSPERCAIAGIPIQSRHQSMLTGEEYLAYLRQVVEIRDINVQLYSPVSALRKEDKLFHLEVKRPGRVETYRSEKLVLATGNMNHVRKLGVPGEDKPHVLHRFEGVHRYFRRRVLIVGGRNSAVEAAIRCWRAGAEVAISYRGPRFDKEKLNRRYHLEIGILTSKNKIRFLPQSHVREFTDEAVILEDPNGQIVHECDDALVQIGFDADLSLMEMADVKLEGKEKVPLINPHTMESSIPNLFLAGTASGGNRSSYKIFVATSHHHGASIVNAITGKESAYTGTINRRVYPFDNADLTPVEGNGGDEGSPAEPL